MHYCLYNRGLIVSLWIMRGFIYVISLILALSSVRCRRTEESVRSVAELPPAPKEMPETIAKIPEEVVLKPVVINKDSVSALISHMKESGHWEEYSEGMLPKMAEHSPRYVKSLLENTYSGFIVVDKGRMKVILFDRFGRMLKTYGMACAKAFGTKHEKGDSRTPEGFFRAEGIYDSTDWLFTDDDGKTSKKKGQFGPRFIRLRIPGTSQIGIHGTCAPWSIGGRSSHGCIRLTNENILELVELVEIGMPVIVIPGKRDMVVNQEEGYESIWIPTLNTSRKPKIEPLVENKDTVAVMPEEPDSIAKAQPAAKDSTENSQKRDSISAD